MRLFNTYLENKIKEKCKLNMHRYAIGILTRCLEFGVVQSTNHFLFQLSQICELGK